MEIVFLPAARPRAKKQGRNIPCPVKLKSIFKLMKDNLLCLLIENMKL